MKICTLDTLGIVGPKLPVMRYTLLKVTTVDILTPVTFLL